MKVYFKELGQGLQSVQTSVEVLEHDLTAVLGLNLLGGFLTVFSLYKLDEIRQFYVSIELVGRFMLDLSKSLQNCLDWLLKQLAFFVCIVQI